MQNKSPKFEHDGKFVSVDFEMGRAWLADTPDEALNLSARENPFGVFYLLRLEHEPS